MPVIKLDVTDSTNNVLKKMASECAPSGTVVTADCQTAGKGRLGRTFESPAGKGIYLSYLMRPEAGMEQISTITCWAAVAAANAVTKVCGITPSIKWVNDLQINGKKICGILTEMTGSAVIIGIGINVNNSPSDLPEQLRDTASSIKQEAGFIDDIDRGALTDALIEELDKVNSNFPGSYREYLDAYRSLCSTVGLDLNIYSAHNSSEPPRLGRAAGIGDDFSLRVIHGDGQEQSLKSGEVTIRRR